MKTVEQRIAFANGIDFAELFRHAEVISGISLVFTKSEVKEIRGDVYIEFHSNNIANSCGVFGKVLRYCHIGTFSNLVTEDRESGELRYWANIHLEYQHHDGGSNGMELFAARYEGGKWTFRDIEPRF